MTANQATPEIAVIGMACRFPSANSPQEYWEMLCSRQNGITSYPPNRPIPACGNAKPADYLASSAGYLKCPIDEFDAGFFAISPREAAGMSPQQRLLLQVAWECLESAGIPPNRLTGSRTGVFIGAWQTAYERTVQEHSLNFVERYLPNSLNGTAARLSFAFGFSGPNVAVESGCSSSLAAIHMACKSLRSGDCQMALCGGVNVLLDAWDAESSPVLSSGPEASCKMWDERADGFARAEGCGLIALKPLHVALADGDTILGTILGSAMNNDGRVASFGTPSVLGQSDVIREALASAGVQAKSISYVEAHGTGTAVGDPIEFEALANGYSCEGRQRPLLIGSCKSNIGHAESAAGIAGVIKILLALQHKEIPPNLHFCKVNPRIELDRIPCQVPIDVTPWEPQQEHERRLAGINSFALGGNNVHMILGEFEARTKSTRAIRGNVQRPEIITLSAKTEFSLLELRDSYISFLKGDLELDLGRFSYTTTMARTHHLEFRAAFCADSVPELISAMEDSDPGNLKKEGVAKNPSRIGFLFRGQGCQYHGMAAGLLTSAQSEFPEFHKSFAECEALFREKTGLCLRALVNDHALDSIYFPLATLSVQVSLCRLWISLGVQPHFVLGHSAGEFAASVCAGVLPLSAAMDLLIQRCRLVGQLERGSRAGHMLVLAANETAVIAMISEWAAAQEDSSHWLEIAAVNSECQTVVAGRRDDLASFQAGFCAGLTSKQLTTLTAFHSRAMDPILEGWGEAVGQIQGSVRPPKVNYLSGATGQYLRSASDFGVNYWRNHMRGPVQFKRALETIVASAKKDEAGDVILIEIGQQAILLPFAAGLKGIGLRLPSLMRGVDNRLLLLNNLRKLYLEGVDLKWEGLGVEEEVQRVRMDIPTYPWARTKYWGGVRGNSQPRPQISLSSHPLLGERISSSADLDLADDYFSNTLSLEKLDLSWMSDYVIGDCVLVPAGALLDTLAAAGTRANESSKEALEVRDLRFEAAIPLFPNHVTKLQTVVEGGKRIRIFSKEDGGKWVKNVEGKFRLLPSNLSNQRLQIRDPLSAPGMEVYEADTVSAIYAKLAAEHGTRFGPNFRLIRRLKAGRRDGAIAEISIHPTPATQYICHPSLLEAMLQTLLFHRILHPSPAKEAGLPELRKGQMLILVGVKMYRCYGNTGGQEQRTLYSHLCFSPGGQDGSLVSLNLYTPSGILLAQVEGMEWVVRDVGGMSPRLELPELQRQRTPDFYQVVWEPLAKGLRAEGALVPIPASSHQTKDDEGERERLAVANKLSIAYMAKTVQELGWTWDLAKVILPPRNLDLTASSRLAKLTAAILNYLEEEGYSRNGIGVKALPDLEACEALIQEYKEGNGDIFLEFVQTCGSNLTGFLRGELDLAHQLLDEDKGLARIYKEWRLYSSHLQLFQSVFAKAVRPLVGKPGTLRILEVGAGTGSATGLICQALEDLGIQDFEYTFTDISKYFLRRAEGKFARHASKFKYNILDLEKDPLSQGYQPQSFHFIMGFQVLHATKDLTESLGNLRMLLDPNGGKLLLGEVFKTIPSFTLIFGMMEGWWRYEDRFRSQGSPLLSGEGWRQALQATGYTNIQIGSILEDEIADGYVLAGSDSGLHLPSISIQKKIWLLFTPDLNKEDKGSLPLISGLEELGRSGAWCKLASTQPKPEEFATVFQGYESDGYEIEGIIFMGVIAPSSADIVQVQTLSCGFTLSLAQAVFSYFEVKPNKPILVGLSRGLQRIPGLDSQTLDPSQATLLGTLKVFVNENPTYALRLLDLDKGGDPYTFSKAEARLILSQLWGQSVAVSFRALRDGVLYKQVLTAMPEEQDPARSLPHYEGFNGESTYLIVGGLGGIGLEVAKWIISLGGRHLVLASRKPPNSPKQSRILDSLREMGGKVVVVQADVGNREECVALLNSVKDSEKMPPLRGIWHAAIDLADATIPNQTWTRFTAVFRAKVYGAWYLHQLSQDLALDHFVLFSSVSSIFAPPGQANHTAANCYMDALVQYRLSRGLKATTLNWGAWYGLGVLEREDYTYNLGEHITPFSNASGIAALEKAWENGLETAVIVDVADWSAMAEQWPVVRGLLDPERDLNVKVKSKFNWKPRAEVPEFGNKMAVDLDEGQWRLPEPKSEVSELGSSSLDAAPKDLELEVYVEGVLKQVLGMRVKDTIPRDKDFGALGLDSLMRMELRNYLHRDLAIQNLSLNALEMHSTLEGLTSCLKSLCSNESRNKVPELGNKMAAPLNSAPKNATTKSALSETLASPLTTHLEEYIEGVLKQILGMRMKDNIPKDKDFTALGLDSLMRMELRNFLHRDLAIQNLSLNALETHSTLEGLTSYLQSLLSIKSQSKVLEHESKTSSPLQAAAKNLEVYVEGVLKEILGMRVKDTIPRDKDFAALGLDSLMRMELRNYLHRDLAIQNLSLNALETHSTLEGLTFYLQGLRSPKSSEPEPKAPNLTPRQKSLEMIQLDSILHADIQALNSSVRTKPGSFKKIFLTGATDFLGSHFFSQLTRISSIQIYCLIPASNTNEDGRDKLLSALSEQGLEGTTNFKNTQVVFGDLSLERFGLPPAEYASLAEEIDVVIHCAGKVNHVEDYCTEEDPGKDFRTQNVLSLLNVLRFVVGGGKVKLLHFASTALVNGVMVDGQLEAYPEAGDCAQTLRTHKMMGYPISRLICEKLLSQASARGIPIITVRYPLLIRSETKTSVTDHVWGLILSFAKTRKIPQLLEWWPVLGVEAAVRISLQVLFNQSAEMGVYNYTPMHVLRNEDLRESVAKGLGVAVETIPLVPYEEWRWAVWNNCPPQSNPLAGFEHLYSVENRASAFQYAALFQGGSVGVGGYSEKLSRNCPQASELGMDTDWAQVIQCHLKHFCNGHV